MLDIHRMGQHITVMLTTAEYAEDLAAKLEGAPASTVKRLRDFDELSIEELRPLPKYKGWSELALYEEAARKRHRPVERSSPS